MKKLIIMSSLMVILLVIGITPAIAVDLGSLNQTRTKHAVYSEDVTIEGIDGQSYVDVTTTNGSITISGNIDGQSTVKLTAQNGSITVMGNIVGNSNVTLLTNGVIIINGNVASDATIVRYKAAGINIYGGTKGKATVETIKSVKPVSTPAN